MKKIIIFLLILGILNFNKILAYKELIIKNIEDKPIRVIKIILDGEHYIVSSVAMTGGNTLENLTKKVGGNTSINGAFFCPDDYSYCNGITHSISERIFMGNGEKYSKYRGDTGIRGIIGFDKEGNPIFVQKNLGYMKGLDININQNKLNNIYFGIGNFPVLLANSSNVLRGAENEIDKKMKLKGSRNFICFTKDQKTIYMGVIGNSNIYELPNFLEKHFDCEYAINLDAGNSLAMIYDGNVLQRSPRRRIMDAFVVLTKKEYKNLTNYLPNTNKKKYINPNKYILNSEDKKFITAIDKFAKQIIKDKGKDAKIFLISFIRKLISKSYKQNNNKKIEIYKQILINLFTVDKI